MVCPLPSFIDCRIERDFKWVRGTLLCHRRESNQMDIVTVETYLDNMDATTMLPLYNRFLFQGYLKGRDGGRFEYGEFETFFKQLADYCETLSLEEKVPYVNFGYGMLTDFFGLNPQLMVALIRVAERSLEGLGDSVNEQVFAFLELPVKDGIDRFQKAIKDVLDLEKKRQKKS